MRLRPLSFACLVALGGCGDAGLGFFGEVSGTGKAVSALPADPSVTDPLESGVSRTPVTLPACRPSAGGPIWVEEGQEVRAKVICATGAQIDPRFLSIRPLPAGAVWNAEEAELQWVPRLDQAGIHALTVVVASGETAPLRIGVADHFDAPGNVPVANAAAYTEELGLPVLHLTVDPQINGDRFTPATVLYRGRTRHAEARHKGNSSLAYPKKSFTIEFRKGDEFSEPDLAGGFVGKRKIALRAVFDDNSYLRDRLAYVLWERLAPDGIRIQSFSAIVYVNGVYQGLYTLVDHIDKFLLGQQGLSAAGNLFKGSSGDANFHPLPELSHVWEKTSGDPPHGQEGAFDDLSALYDFVNNADDDSFRAQVGQRIALADYRAWLILSTAIQAQDTLGKNTYHFHDPQGGPFRVVPWDFNHSFGQDWMTRREDPNIPVHALVGGNRLFTRLWEDQVLGPATRAGYRSAIDQQIPAETVLAAFAALTEEIAPAARRDERLWRQHYLTYERWAVRTDFTDFDEEVRSMRQWIRERWAFLASSL